MKTVTIWTCRQIGEQLYEIHAGFFINWKMHALTRHISYAQIELSRNTWRPYAHLYEVIREMTHTIDEHIAKL